MNVIITGIIIYVGYLCFPIYFPAFCLTMIILAIILSVLSIEEEMMGGWCEDCNQEVMFFKKSFNYSFRCIKCGAIGRTVKFRTHR